MSGRTAERALATIVALLLVRATWIAGPRLGALWAHDRVGLLVAAATAAAALAWLVRHLRGGRTVPAALAQHPSGQVGLVVVATVVLATLLSVCLTDAPPAAPPTPLSAPPSWAHPFGTDAARRDLLTLTLRGGRRSLGVAALATGLGTALGALVGAGAALRPGPVERGLAALTDLALALPRLLVLLVVLTLVGPGARDGLVGVVLGLTGWMGTARVVRTELLAVRELDYVQAARALGLRERTILRRHLLPAVWPTVGVWAPVTLGSSLLTEAALAFLGPGAGSGAPSWGALVAAAGGQTASAWWLLVFPAGAITLTVVGANLLAEGLRDALEPRSPA